MQVARVLPISKGDAQEPTVRPCSFIYSVGSCVSVDPQVNGSQRTELVKALHTHLSEGCCHFLCFRGLRSTGKLRVLWFFRLTGTTEPLGDNRGRSAWEVTRERSPTHKYRQNPRWAGESEAKTSPAPWFQTLPPARYGALFKWRRVSLRFFVGSDARGVNQCELQRKRRSLLSPAPPGSESASVTRLTLPPSGAFTAPRWPEVVTPLKRTTTVT